MISLVVGVLAAWLLIGFVIGIIAGHCIHAGMALREYDAPAPMAERQAA